jgi:hypothetical protein
MRLEVSPPWDAREDEDECTRSAMNSEDSQPKKNAHYNRECYATKLFCGATSMQQRLSATKRNYVWYIIRMSVISSVRSS